MKQYITIAALIAAGAAFASADDEQTLSPLSDWGNWEHNAYNPNAGNPSYNSTSNKYYWKELDQQGYSSYDSFDKIVLDSADDYFSFSYNLRRGLYKADGEVLTLALVGSNAIVTGYSGAQSVSYEVTDIIAESYTFDPCTWGGTTLTGTALCNLSTATMYKFEGTTSWDATLSEFVLSLTLNTVAETITPVATAKVALGSYLEIEELIISINGAKKVASKSYPELSELSLSWGHVAVPEPSAFGLLAGLGALALVGTRRRRR